MKPLVFFCLLFVSTFVSAAAPIVLEIPKMSCGGCVSTIKGTLKRQKGIKESSIMVDLKTKEATFECETNAAGRDACDLPSIQQALAKKKYPATQKK